MPIIATAGHVDHGKSTLVQALTGRDPDRWAEEKERGLTIDLGFAWTQLGGHDVGFVDVPGHERFIKNMLAGMGAVDVALFVVAADEGWMPQSEEHLAVLDALEIRHGVIALTRIDLVDPDLAELAAAEVSERTDGTSLEGSAIIPVSAVTGAGIDALLSALDEALHAAGAPTDIGRPRMWIDRAFVVGGAGLVVTGTLADGSLHKGDPVSLIPGQTVRIRTIQSHEKEVETIGPGNRVALNLPGVDHDVVRGTMLDATGEFTTSKRLLAQLQPVRAWPGAVSDRGAYHLHAGTGRWPVRIRLLAGKELDATGPALLSLDEPVPLRMADRFVIREVGRRVVVAGGIVLDPHPASRIGGDVAAQLAAVLPGGDRNLWSQTLLEIRGLTTHAALDADTGGGRPIGGIGAGDAVMTADYADATTSRLVDIAASYHTANPLRPGIPTATLASVADVDQNVLEVLIARHASGLVNDGATVRQAGFNVSRTADQQLTWVKAQELLRHDGLAVPRTSSLGLDQELLHEIVRSGELVIVGGDVAYLPEQVDEVLGRLKTIGDGFTVSEFRDALGVSRRQAVPLLEWLDAAGWTSRRGDVRMVRPRPTPPAGGAPPR